MSKFVSKKEIHRKVLMTLLPLVLIPAFLGLVVWPATIPAGQGCGGERNASGTLKQLSSIQVTFKTSDTDGNGVSDYWVDDIAGLYYPSPVSPPTAASMIKMIELSTARADGSTASQYEIPGSMPTAHSASPKAGYWFFALDGFEGGDGSITPYSQTRVNRWGAIAVPDMYRSGSRFIFIISEAGRIYKKDPGSEAAYLLSMPAVGAQNPRGLLTPAYSYFPFYPESAGWERMN